MNITLKQLQVFRAVARCENLGTAAQQLFITKGAVSQSLQELEKQLGLQLFDRVHPRLYINHEGRRLLPLADEMLQRTVEMERIFSNDVGDTVLAAGCSKTIGNSVMPALVAAFSSRHGWVPAMSIANTSQLCQQVAAFSLDVALLEGEERHPDLYFEPWLEDHMVVVAPREHHLQVDVTYSLEAVANESWVLREPDSGSRAYFEHRLAPLLSSHSVLMELDSPEAILAVVAEGLGLGFSSRLSVEQSAFAPRLKILCVEQEFPRTFSLCYHKKKYHSHSMRSFLEHCRTWSMGAAAG